MSRLNNSAPPVEVAMKTYSLGLVAREVGLSEKSVLMYVAEGMVAPSAAASAGETVFDDDALCVLRRIVFLTEVRQVNLSGLRVIMSLHKEVETLRETVRFYQSQL